MALVWVILFPLEFLKVPVTKTVALLTFKVVADAILKIAPLPTVIAVEAVTFAFAVTVAEEFVMFKVAKAAALVLMACAAVPLNSKVLPVTVVDVPGV